MLICENSHVIMKHVKLIFLLRLPLNLLVHPFITFVYILCIYTPFL